MRICRDHLILLSLTITLGSCTTWTSVEKVDPGSNVKGLRYSLPATFLLVQPQPDGTATYDWVYLPDSDNTYAIRQHAILSKFTMDVTLSNGMLSKVNDQGDSSQVLSKLLDASQAVYSAKQGAIATQKKTDTATLTAAQAAVKAAQLAYDQAKAEASIINAAASSSTSDQKRAAELKLIDAEIALNDAKKSLAVLKGGTGSADAPTPSAHKQYGPVLFRVLQTADGDVKLVAVNAQTQYDAPGAASGSTQNADYQLTLTTTTPLPAAPKPILLSVQIDRAIEKLDGGDSSVRHADSNKLTERPAWHLNDDHKSFTVAFDKGLPAGSYILMPAVVVLKDGTAKNDQHVPFEVGSSHAH